MIAVLASWKCSNQIQNWLVKTVYLNVVSIYSHLYHSKGIESNTGGASTVIVSNPAAMSFTLWLGSSAGKIGNGLVAMKV